MLIYKYQILVELLRVRINVKFCKKNELIEDQIKKYIIYSLSGCILCYKTAQLLDFNLNIIITKHLDGDRYVDKSLTLFSVTPDTPDMAFIWEGKYNEKTIKVTLPKNTLEEYTKIENAETLNIDNQILKEVKRVMKYLD